MTARSVPVVAYPTDQGPLRKSAAGRRSYRRRAGVGVGALVAVVIAALAWNAVGREPVDGRPISVPAELGGQRGTVDPVASGQAAQTQRSLLRRRPGRQVAVRFYDSRVLAPAGHSAEAASTHRGEAGAHLIVVRGRFPTRTGDTHLVQAVAHGDRSQFSSAHIGDDRCEWMRTIAVCWRESNRLSVSVLHEDGVAPGQIAAEVDEAWTAVR